MPYIQDRDRLRAARWPITPGELNYAITRLILNYAGTRPDYQKYNEVVGALECAKLELYRRRLAEYEDAKMAEPGHGDVYE